MPQTFTRRPKLEKPAIVHGENYITPGGLKRLIDEREVQLTKDRPAVVAVVSWAAENGDLSENADYQYSKRRLRELSKASHYNGSNFSPGVYGFFVV